MVPWDEIFGEWYLLKTYCERFVELLRGDIKWYLYKLKNNAYYLLIRATNININFPI